MKLWPRTLLILFMIFSHWASAASKNRYCESQLVALDMLTLFSVDRRHYDCFLWGYQRNTSLYYNLHLEGVEPLPLGRYALAFTDLDAPKTRTILISERAGFSFLSEAFESEDSRTVSVKRSCLTEVMKRSEIENLRIVQRNIFHLPLKADDLYFQLNKPSYIRDPWIENVRLSQIQDSGGYAYWEVMGRKFHKLNRDIGDDLRAFLMSNSDTDSDTTNANAKVQVRRLKAELARETLYVIEVANEKNSALFAQGDLVQHVHLFESFSLKFRDDTEKMLISIPGEYVLVFE